MLPSLPGEEVEREALESPTKRVRVENPLEDGRVYFIHCCRRKVKSLTVFIQKVRRQITKQTKQNQPLHKFQTKRHYVRRPIVVQA